MGWYRMDENFAENDKVSKLKHPAFRLHVAALGYCSRNLTDGYVSDRAVRVLGAILEFPTPRHVAQLVEVELWAPDENAGGYWINDYLVYNPDSETVKALRDERSTAGKKGAAKRWGNKQPPKQESWQEPSQEPMAQTEQDVPQTYLKAVTADHEIEVEIDKILRAVTKKDDGTRGVLLSIAKKLPLSSVAKVRESCQGKKVGAGYAVKALQDELADLEERNEEEDAA